MSEGLALLQLSAQHGVRGSWGADEALGWRGRGHPSPSFLPPRLPVPGRCLQLQPRTRGPPPTPRRCRVLSTLHETWLPWHVCTGAAALEQAQLNLDPEGPSSTCWRHSTPAPVFLRQGHGHRPHDLGAVVGMGVGEEGGSAVPQLTPSQGNPHVCPCQLHRPAAPQAPSSSGRSPSPGLGPASLPPSPWSSCTGRMRLPTSPCSVPPSPQSSGTSL